MKVKFFIEALTATKKATIKDITDKLKQLYDNDISKLEFFQWIKGNNLEKELQSLLGDSEKTAEFEKQIEKEDNITPKKALEYIKQNFSKKFKGATDIFGKQYAINRFRPEGTYWTEWSKLGGRKFEFKFRKSVGYPSGRGSFSMDIDQIAKGLGVPNNDEYKKIILDGRFLGLLYELKLCAVNNWERETKESSPYDVIVNGKKFEVRAFSKSNNIYFNPSSDRGSYRTFNLEKFYGEKLSNIDGYIIVDPKYFVSRGYIVYYIVSKQFIEALYLKGFLNKRTDIKADKMRYLIAAYAGINTLGYSANNNNIDNDNVKATEREKNRVKNEENLL